MANAAPRLIPRELSEAFHRAVLLYLDWSPAAAEPQISAGMKLRTMRAVCELVADYNDPLPPEIFNTLYHQMHIGHERRKEKLGVDASYSIGGYCLLKLIEHRKTEYQRLEELRRDQ